MFRERLMDIVRLTMKEPHYTEKLEELVDAVNKEIEDHVTGIIYELKGISRKRGTRDLTDPYLQF